MLMQVPRFLARALRMGRVTLHDKPCPEPEPLATLPRPVSSFFGGLTPDQKQMVSTHRGNDEHGDPTFLKKNLGKVRGATT